MTSGHYFHRLDCISIFTCFLTKENNTGRVPVYTVRVALQCDIFCMQGGTGGIFTQGHKCGCTFSISLFCGYLYKTIYSEHPSSLHEKLPSASGVGAFNRKKTHWKSSVSLSIVAPLIILQGNLLCPNVIMNMLWIIRSYRKYPGNFVAC